VKNPRKAHLILKKIFQVGSCPESDFSDEVSLLQRSEPEVVIFDMPCKRLIFFLP
jgi:hypothetical protein